MCSLICRSLQAAPKNCRRREKTSKTYLLMGVLLGGSCLAVAQTAAGVKMTFSGHAVVNVQELAEQEKLHPSVSSHLATPVPEMRQPDLQVPSGAPMIYLTKGRNAAAATSSGSASQPASPQSSSLAPLSPVARFSFAGTSDNQLRIPPSAQAAVSPTYLVETVNGTFTVQNRTGGLLQTVLMDNFWASVGGVTGVVNARVVYDPYNSRWIMAAEGNGNTINSVVLIGVSQNSTPTSTWNLFKVNSDPGSTANFASLGFNANWIAVSMNMYQLNCSTNCFQQVNLYVFNKVQLYANNLGTVSKFIDSKIFTYVPAVTYDNNPATPLYLLQKWNENFNGVGYLRLGSITGTATAPSVNFQVSFVGFGTPWA